MSQFVIALMIENRRCLRGQRRFQDRTNPLTVFSESESLHNFGIRREQIIQLSNEIGQYIDVKINKAYSLRTVTQILITLRFYKSGSFQYINGDLIHVHQSSVSRCISKVTKALVKIKSKYIYFPSTEEQFLIKNGFSNKSSIKFPNVIGTVDGSFVKIKSPGREIEPLYVCRKGGHAVNVQILCDHQMRIRDVVAKWPATTHDSFIWMNCSLRAKFMLEKPNGWLLGDSGYALEPWLLTPLLQAKNETEERYNSAHKKTRRTVENAIGLLKGVWLCLHSQGGDLCYKPKKVCEIVISCCILHNIRRSLKLNEDDIEFDSENLFYETSEIVSESTSNTLRSEGQHVRKQLIESRF